MGDVADAARLLRYACTPKLLPTKEPAYLELVRSWPQRPDLQRAAEEMAGELGLWIVAVEPSTGVICCAEGGSPFEVTVGDFLRAARAEQQWGMRVVFGLTLLAAWRLCYPKPGHLDDPERAPRLSADELVAYVDGLCARLDAHVEALEVDVDPPVDEPELERAWRSWVRRSKTARTPDGRRSPRTTSALVSKALEWMAEQGLLEKRNDAEGGTYLARPRLRVLVKEVAASTLYGEVVRLTGDEAEPERDP